MKFILGIRSVAYGIYEVKQNGSEGNGTKVFKIKKVEDKYMIYFVDKYGEEQELGELIIKPEL